LKRLSLIVIALTLVTSAHAQRRAAPKAKNPAPKSASKSKATQVKDDLKNTNKGAYGMAGCGLGSLVFADSESRVSQVLAATTNGTYMNNTFAVTSGTSNCVPDASKTASLKKNMGMFIAANREALANDVVKSNGDTIVAMGQIMGCKDSEYLGAKLQSRYENIFSSKEDSTVAANMYDTVSSDRYLIENCTL